jgi:ABC-type spermidine/putrescine transport system permease subunit II
LILRALRLAPLAVLVLLLTLPVLALLGAWLPLGADGAQAGAILREMAATVLPEYLWTTLWLGLAVAVGAAVVGTACAAAVTLFDFRGRRAMEWLLLLPLAMPAYVTAYAYTDFLQFSGPLQVWMRAAFGLEGRLLPEVRSLGGAVWVFIFSLYPYVYLLARTALGERAAHLMEAARLLGASPARRIRSVALPLARPAVAAGVALVLMETLADFGVASYFGIQTFTTGIYKAWLSMDDRLAAARARPRRSPRAWRAGTARWRGWCACCRWPWASWLRCCSCCGRWRPTGRSCRGRASWSGRATACAWAPSPPCWPWPSPWRWPLRCAGARTRLRVPQCSSWAWATRCRVR